MMARAIFGRAVVLLIGSQVLGCGNSPDSAGPTWAANIGGPAYVGLDGTLYRADEFAQSATSGAMDRVKGSQDPALYRTFRTGQLHIARPLANGSYDVTLHFAEPDDIAGGERVFDVLIEGERKIRGLDIMSWRDGKTHSALTVTVPDVELTDGELNIDFDPVAGDAVLSAVVARRAVAATASWELVWRDEFEVAGAPDPQRWTIDEWPARKVNDEDQTYTAREKNIRVADGHLVIEAHRETLNDALYTSGRVHTQNKGDFLYGRFEVRARLPRGTGTWPAIWMLPSDPFKYATRCAAGDEWQGSAECDAWPNSGEIDIMEHVGYQMGHVHGTVHNEAYYWLKWEQRKGRVIVDDVDDAFHVYALEWSPQRIDIFLDDTLYFTYLNENGGWRSWPYNHPFHLIINIAVGGMWGRSGGGIDDTVFPQQMLVDYVRVYRRREQ